MLCRILDHDRHRVGIVQGIPDHVEPEGIAELLGLVPFVRGQADRLPPLSALDLDTTDSVNRIAIAGLTVGGAETVGAGCGYS